MWNSIKQVAILPISGVYYVGISVTCDGANIDGTLTVNRHPVFIVRYHVSNAMQTPTTRDQYGILPLHKDDELRVLVATYFVQGGSTFCADIGVPVVNFFGFILSYI